MPPRDDFPDTTQQRDELLSTLTDQHCRFVLRHFKDASEEVASVADLSTAFVRKNGGADRDQAAIQFHHSALPRLDDVGVVDYDPRSKTVRYHGHARLEDWCSRIGKPESVQVMENR